MTILEQNGYFLGCWRGTMGALDFLDRNPGLSDTTLKDFEDLRFPFFILSKNGEWEIMQSFWEVEKAFKGITLSIDADKYFDLYLMDKEWENEGFSPEMKGLKHFPVTNYAVRGFRKKGWDWFLALPEEE